ncbi:sensor histidine kinase [Duganella aceris]|uniref:histidine kinase n=1 Tax=Duganella aceris TaxID=2703883 RepID=A0ABX0FKY6_9BURK|nr:ATP-binding protein [Duganella aceris]NGZ85256.1 hypothetical protein [Duganella aceris]
MKNTRFGLTVLISALIVISLVMLMLVKRQHTQHESQLRIQGLGVVHAMSALPMSVLVPASGRSTVLSSLFLSHETPDFAYAAVSALDGAIVAETTAPGVLVGALALPSGGASLFGERDVPARAQARAVREFYGPVLEQDVLKGYVRVAFFEPRHALALGDLPFYASLTLALFLLVPLVIFLVRREMAPLRKINEQLQRMALGGGAALPAHGDVGEFAAGLQQHLDTTAGRIAALEQDKAKATANGRLVEYNNSKMSAVLQCMPDGLMILDMSGEVTFASSKIEPLLGVRMDQVLSEPVAAWCQDAELSALLNGYRGDGGERARQSTVEFAPARLPGKRLRATAQPLTGGLGLMAFGTLIVVRDATREHLTRQAGSDFVAHVSHELKSPLNVIAMYTEVLQDTGPDARELRVEALNVIQDEVERMNSLVNNLLNVSKLETGSMNPERNRVRLDDLLRDAYDQALPRAQMKAIDMQLNLPRELAAVAIDKDMFRVALNNLLTNAVKYNIEGGTVVLSAQEGEHEVVITVRDSGIGIAPADQAQVFEKFYRAKDDDASGRGGHGLGLYLAGQIIELHHGRITLESSPGRGSAFSIHLKKMPAMLEGMTNL